MFKDLVLFRLRFESDSEAYLTAQALMADRQGNGAGVRKLIGL